MKREIIVALFLLTGLSACSLAPDYRAELQEKGLAFTPEEFLKSAEAGGLAAVALYLNAGMDPNATDSEGVTALMKASYKGHADVVQLLLESGADANLEDREGRTALDYASTVPGNGVFQTLVSQGALYGSLEPAQATP